MDTDEVFMMEADGVLDNSGDRFQVGDATTPSTILCCLCGATIAPNAANMCVNCIRGRVDITEGIPKRAALYYCRFCGRYLQPPRRWIRAELESPELLALLVRRLKGLHRVKLVDAAFKWTEPHSRRIQLRLTIQKEVFTSAILQEEFLVEFVVHYQQCEACRRDAAKIDAWQAVVQVRQKVEHKRTFLYLEQLILRHNAHDDTLGVKTQSDGVDFYFAQRSAAIKFVSFLQQVVPMRYRSSDHLVSHDPHNNTYRYKYTYSVDIAPVCRDDLVCLPPRLCASLGGIGPIVLVTRVTHSIVVTEPASLRSAEILPSVYWRHEFSALMTSRQLSEYTVLDAELTGESSGKLALSELTVAKSSDLGANDNVTYLQSHLGNILHAGDLALGYDVENANFNDSPLKGHRRLELPSVVLVKKSFPESKRNRRRRRWKLRSMVVEGDGGELVPDRRGGESNAGSGRGIDAPASDRETFMRDLEEDPQLRAGVNMYKADDVGSAGEAATDADGDDDDEYPQVGVEELLDNLQLDTGADEELDDGDDDAPNDGDDDAPNDDEGASIGQPR